MHGHCLKGVGFYCTILVAFPRSTPNGWETPWLCLKNPTTCPSIWSVPQRFMWIWPKSVQLITDVSQRIRSACRRPEWTLLTAREEKRGPTGRLSDTPYPSFQERADITQRDMLSLLGSPDRKGRKAMVGRQRGREWNGKKRMEREGEGGMERGS